jgi:hypothetical protein
MLMRINDIKYLNRIAIMIEGGEPIIRKGEDVLGGKIDSRMMFCDECDQEIEDQWDSDHIIMRDASDHPFIAIACEGYHFIDIN